MHLAILNIGANLNLPQFGPLAQLVRAADSIRSNSPERIVAFMVNSYRFDPYYAT